MTSYPPTGYIMFSLKKLKFYGSRRPGAGARGPGAEGRITETPFGSDLILYIPCFTQFYSFQFPKGKTKEQQQQQQQKKHQQQQQKTDNG